MGAISSFYFSDGYKNISTLKDEKALITKINGINNIERLRQIAITSFQDTNQGIIEQSNIYKSASYLFTGLSSLLLFSIYLLLKNETSNKSINADTKPHA